MVRNRCAHPHHPLIRCAQMGIAVASPAPTGNMLPTPALCNQGSLKPLAPRGFGLAFHTNLKLCTGVFRQPVGDVGNWGPLANPSAQLSKHPQIHSPVLENPSHPQPHSLQSHRKVFHFSCHNYGGYCLFFYLSTPFHPYPSLFLKPLPGSSNPSPLPCSKRVSAPRKFAHPRCVSQPQNPEIGRLFHPHGRAEDEYNQMRTRDPPFHSATMLLYRVASAGFWFSRRGCVYADRRNRSGEASRTGVSDGNYR